MKAERYIREYANAEKKNGKEWMTKEEYYLYCKRIEKIINVRELRLFFGWMTRADIASASKANTVF